MKRLSFFVSLLTVVLLSSCNDGKVNFFTLNQDVEFGQQVVAEILSDSQYNVLDRDEHKEAYEYLEGIRDKILASKDIRYRDRFQWDIYIIDEDVLNAFALPGGPTFYYTGLMKFLDDEASLAGVMAHEIAHVDRRHATNRMTKMYGFSILFSVLRGDNESLLGDIAESLATGVTALAFSRQDEYEADEYAVRYLYPTELDSRGVAYFFEKMDLAPASRVQIYLSTHPDPGDRISEIHRHHQRLGGKEGNPFTQRYQEFLQLLP
ncbi:M48 family metalloprotease [Natronoflexus pectinivorans]|uniref:Peptidase M48-like protein n=1 Tax=Natronoflexus pectinivorans TaxID=682526 RepID=A0A4R2GLW8_9BACT|nr:M48 family metalloprotease [Natronoflexus pectinivorans]TCO09308.1 peptidase M48-like protein [Natronoflexus pectinivorans]